MKRTSSLLARFDPSQSKPLVAVVWRSRSSFENDFYTLELFSFCRIDDKGFIAVLYLLFPAQVNRPHGLTSKAAVFKCLRFLIDRLIDGMLTLLDLFTRHTPYCHSFAATKLVTYIGWRCATANPSSDSDGNTVFSPSMIQQYTHSLTHTHILLKSGSNGTAMERARPKQVLCVRTMT